MAVKAFEAKSAHFADYGATGYALAHKLGDHAGGIALVVKLFKPFDQFVIPSRLCHPKPLFA
jgi:hypothetical protein